MKLHSQIQEEIGTVVGRVHVSAVMNHVNYSKIVVGHFQQKLLGNYYTSCLGKKEVYGLL